MFQTFGNFHIRRRDRSSSHIDELTIQDDQPNTKETKFNSGNLQKNSTLKTARTSEKLPFFSATSLKNKDLPSKIFLPPIQQPQPAEEPKEEEPSPIVRNDNAIPRQIQVFPDSFMKRMDEPIRNRINVELPMQELNAVTTQVKTTIDFLHQDIETIDTNVIRTNKKIGEVSQKIRLLQGKAVSLSQTTEAVNAKLTVLDDWLDGLEGAGGSFKMRTIEFFVKMFTFISSLFLLLWNSIKSLNPLKWHLKKKQQIEKKDDISPESTTDDLTEPGS